jgi:hypothetical protein
MPEKLTKTEQEILSLLQKSPQGCFLPDRLLPAARRLMARRLVAWKGATHGGWHLLQKHEPND